MKFNLINPIALSLLLLSVNVYATNGGGETPAKKTIEAVRIDSKPKIDGILDDEVYETAKPFEGDFFQMSPDNGAPSAYKTKVYVVYTDYGLYIGAQMFDPEPNTIPKELGIRDDMDKNVDMFGIVVDPVNKGQNAFYYIVTAAGVQGDAVASSNDDDWNWDAVWNSAVSFNDEGWAVEMEIPYSAIRFPKHSSGDWGINFYRVSKRLNEEATWNFVDQEVSGFINQAGTLKGLENIEPPLRLSFSPYLSGAVSYDGASNSYNASYAAGMDVKWGLSESFTMDMSLIPDFSQVQQDDQVLNLSPFEVQFDENRPFFTEGTELFTKGNIFYSRRVGQSRGYVNEDDLDSTEEVESVPSTAPLLNAMKISGRTAKGTGIGLFNAVTRETNAVIKNTETGATHEYLIDPLSNFNVFVVDQNLKNNSNFGVINTNVTREGPGRDANVTLGQLRLRDKTNTWSFFTEGGYSHVATYDEGEQQNKNGFRSKISFSKVSGKFNFTLGTSQESDTWDINDMGYLRAPNEFNVYSYFSYNIYKPFSVFNRLNSWFNINHEQLYAPRTFTEFNVNGGAWLQFKNFYSIETGLSARPVDSYDYFEAREPGRKYWIGPNYDFYVWGGTDTRKAFRINGFVGMWFRNADNAKLYFSRLRPSYRVNNKLSVDYEFYVERGYNTKGYADKVYDSNDELESIIFGNREQNTLENILSVNYTFNNKMGLTFRLRHYWSWVEYKEFYNLEEDGTLGPTNFNGFNSADGHSPYNRSYNAFTVDFVYSWQIGPGSFVKFNWKDAIFTESEDVEHSYTENIGSTLRDNHLNTVSLKLIYYLDISYFKRLHKNG
ncbi:MAG: carbohydrate binding family 9 domain-containing protein [Cyclobacteriaceae bacterium]|nr:carbohydrate binding family 9 domain-containing protein [Cyclobacteriaceae bacterium]